jgi:hypothetical protein
MTGRSYPYNRRNSVRLSATCPGSHARYDEEGRPFDQRPSRSLNLSSEGVALQSRFPVDLGETLKVTMALGEDLVSFRGEVVYVKPMKGHGFEFGISIRDIGKTDRVALTRFIYYFKPSEAE